MKDVLIVGLGPAGISAAIYLKRSGVDPLLIGKDLGNLELFPLPIENYYGFSEPIYSKTLVQNGIAQAQHLGIEIKKEAVIEIAEKDQIFYVKTAQNEYQARTVILASGKKLKSFSVPGFNKFKGKGISFCATCDGYFYRRKKIAIIGHSAYMKNELAYLSQLNQDITIFTNGEVLNETFPFPVVNEKITKFLGDQKLTGIKTSSGQIYDVDGAFVAVDSPGSLEFAQQIGIIVEKGHVVVDEKYQTNIPGLFAIGDIIGGKLQIAKAVYDGMMVADDIKRYLKKKNK